MDARAHVSGCLATLDRTIDVEPGSPWENGYVEWFDGKPRDESFCRGPHIETAGRPPTDRAGRERGNLGGCRQRSYTRGVCTAVRQVAVCISLPIALLLGIGAAGAEDLEPGARAPGFELLGSDGNTYTLSQFVGKQGVVLAWFPRAFTPG
jgi:hypothetical protein